jgi:hypothetical membrane protein
MKLLLSLMFTAIAVSSQAQQNDGHATSMGGGCILMLSIFFLLLVGVFFLGANYMRNRKDDGKGSDQNTQLR